MPHFAILEHDHPFPHWDFLLENGAACRTWRLLAPPDSTMNPIPAEAMFDHRLMYLDYEGEISGGRGSVARWDTGFFEWRVHRSDICEVTIMGIRWHATVRLVKTDGKYWTLSRIA